MADPRPAVDVLETPGLGAEISYEWFQKPFYGKTIFKDSTEFVSIKVLKGGAKKDEEMEVKKGDTVLYGKYAGQELTIDGEDYLLVSQTDILFIA